MLLSFGELASCDDGPNTGEAIALVLAAMAAWDRSDSVAPVRPHPYAPGFALAADGRVFLIGRLSLEATGDPVCYFARLVRRLLRLDRVSVDQECRAAVPGGLLLLIARALGEIDLPALSLAEFRRGLVRFQAVDERGLAAVYARITNRAEPHVIGRSAFREHGRGAAARAAVAAALLAAVAFAAYSGMTKPGGKSEETPIVPDAVTLRVVDQPAVVVREADTMAISRGTRSSAVTPHLVLETPATEPLLSSTLVGGADVFSPSFTRDGETLLFHTGRSRSALMRATFRDNRPPAILPVVQDGATNYHGSASPDGEWVAYDSDRDGTRGVYVARNSGLEPRRISGDGYAAVPTWSPDGRQLAFTRAESSRPDVWNIWLLDRTSGATRRITRHTVGQAWGASWFPDSRRIAYSVEDTLVVMNLHDGTRQTYKAPQPGRLVRTPAVSPDGTRIVFQLYRDGAWLVDVASGRMRRVLADASAEEFAWSPDGRRVVFHTRRRGAWSVWQLQIAPST